MVTIGMNYKVIPGKEHDFIAMWNKVLEIMNGAEGHAESHLYSDVNEPNSFLIVSEWTRKDAFDAFTRSETFAKVVSWGREQILMGRPKHEIYGQDEP
jgi:heme-degrading monooxygenase HmoA